MAKVRAKEKYRNTEGIIVPSVTTALGILDKPALLRWANRLGLEGIDMDKYRDELASVGTLTHYMILCGLKEEIPDLSEYTPEQVEMADNCYRQYLDWEARYPVRPILVEEPLISEKYQYGGTLDLYALCRKELLLVDFKTNAKGIFPEMVYQVAAYRQLLVEHGYHINRAIILRLGRGNEGGADEKVITSVELDTGWEIFYHALAIYNLKRVKREGK